MNPQYLMKSVQLILEKHEKTDNLVTADCIEAIAQCTRTIAKTDAFMGAIVWSAVKLARGEASYEAADSLEEIVSSIRLKARQKAERSIVGVR